MTDVLREAKSILKEAKYKVIPLREQEKDYLVFESNAIFGFVQAYDKVESLLSLWKDDKDRLLKKFAHQFRFAGPKAWNIYTVLLTGDTATEIQFHALQNIEENLSETRKIARSNLETSDDVRAGMLPLLPFAYISSLPPLDIREEILMRAQDLPKAGLDAFLSDVELSEVAQLLEQE